MEGVDFLISCRAMLEMEIKPNIHKIICSIPYLEIDEVPLWVVAPPSWREHLVYIMCTTEYNPPKYKPPMKLCVVGDGPLGRLSYLEYSRV